MTLTEMQLLRTAMRMLIETIHNLGPDDYDSQRQDIRQLYIDTLESVVNLNKEINRERFKNDIQER